MMKKMFALLLAAVMCLSLAACGGGSEKEALVGQWKSLEEGDVIEFKEDGTGVWYEQPFEWSYEKADKKYAMTAMGITITFEIVEENGIRSLTQLGMFSPWKYYHIDDYEKAMETANLAAVEELNSYTEGKTKIEIGKSYDYAEGVSVVFRGASVIQYGNYQYVCIDAAFTSDSSVEEVDIYPAYKIDYKTYYLYDSTQVTSTGSHIQWGANLGDQGGAMELQPGGTVETRGSVYCAHDYNASLDRISNMICSFELDGTEYYMDLSEYIH